MALAASTPSAYWFKRPLAPKGSAIGSAPPRLALPSRMRGGAFRLAPSACCSSGPLCENQEFRTKKLTLKNLTIFCAKDMHKSEVRHDGLRLRKSFNGWA